MEKRQDGDAVESDEKRVADKIEETITHPVSIEEEAMLEAAEIEELRLHEDSEGS